MTAHQNIPFGGYGMNTGLGDAYDLGWKLAMVLHKQGGEKLLDSYEVERRPVAIRNVSKSGINAEVHMKYASWVNAEPAGTIRSETPAGRNLRERLRSHVLTDDGENKNLGIEMGYRHSKSPVIVPDGNPNDEPIWTEKDYFPSTWPGARAPHVYLNDGVTPIFDLLGFDFTLVDFTGDGSVGKEFAVVATRLDIPLSLLHLPNEKHARQIWERDIVLVRPDHHVSWRSNVSQSPNQVEIEDILLVSSGRK
jgi:FAD-dependent monooxygenase